MAARSLSRRLVTEFSFRIPGHRTEFSGAFSGRFFFFLFFGQFVSLTPIPLGQGDYYPGLPRPDAFCSRSGSDAVLSCLASFQRRQTHARLGPTRISCQGKTRYPIKIAAKADAESLLLSPWREIDFSLLRGRLNGTSVGERRRCYRVLSLSRVRSRCATTLKASSC